MVQRRSRVKKAGCSPSRSVILEGLFLFSLLHKENGAPLRARTPEVEVETETSKKEITMKSGVIVYVAGQAPADWTEEKEASLKQAAAGADAVEFITSRSGHFDIADAWHALTVRGMNRIVCKSAVFDGGGQLRLTGKEMRLCG
jgi:hypothetical protein